MLFPMPEMVVMEGRLPFDVALGPMLVVALIVMLALGFLGEVGAFPALRTRARRRAWRARRLASATTRL